MTAIIQRFWREPKPSCNWCPRITYAIIPDASLGCPVLEIPNGQNMLNSEILTFINARFPSVTGVQEFFSELELTKKQFKRLES